MNVLFRKQSPVRIIAFGFAFVILTGSLLLMLPCSVKKGIDISYIDSLYTATSAVCVTGLMVIDAGDTFTAFGQFVLAMLIQIGGLGVTAIGAGVILAIGKKIDLKSRTIIREAMNLNSGKGVVIFIKNIFLTTLIFEGIGAVLSFIVFVQEYPIPKAIGVSVFHSIAAFNNAGIDILGNFENLIPYKHNVLINLVTCSLVFFGGIGFLVVREMWQKRFHWKKFSMHAKVVLCVSGFLIVFGAILIKCTEEISWMGAFFCSISARTAGFSTYSLGEFTTTGLLVVMILMFIGASPGSTGGGIKTSTFFVLLQGVKSFATNKSEKAFHYAIPKDAFRKASVIVFLSASTIVIGTFFMTILEPKLALTDIMFEVTSAFGTVGLSTGISPELSFGSKLLTICIMYIGRIGPLTVASLWYFSRGERVRFPDGNIVVG